MLSAIFSVLFNYLLYTYLDRLEKIGCDCGLVVQRASIKSSVILNYILIFGSVMYEGKVPLVTSIMVMIYNIVSTINIFIYLYKLKNEKCKCSESLVRDVYYYYYYLNFVLIMLLLTMMLGVVLMKKM